MNQGRVDIDIGLIGRVAREEAGDLIEDVDMVGVEADEEMAETGGDD
jgi:hypothetical protein